MHDRHSHTATRRHRFWRTSWGAAVAAALLIAAAGCGGGESPKGNGDTGWVLDDTGSDDVGPDVAPDTGTDTGPDVGPTPEADSTTFKMVNRTDAPIRIQPQSTCTETDSSWLTVQRGGDRLQAEAICGGCSCEDVEENDGTCPPSLCDCAPASPRLLEAGESVTWTWKGYAFVDDRVSGEACTRKTIPDRGTYEANFCWTDPGVTPHEEKATDCKKVSFEYGTDETVRHVVEGDSTTEPNETTFRLRNDTESEIEIVPRSDCGGGPNAWVGLEQGGEQVKMTSWCGDCRCNRVSDDGACGVCGAACVEPQPERLAPGETKEFEWAGHLFPQDRKNGTACYRKTTPEPSQPLEAVFCWEGPPLPPETRPPAERHCKRVQFTYGEKTTVEHTVTSDDETSPTPTTFELVNDSNEPIRYQKSESCGGPGWLEVGGGQLEVITDRCSVCKCSQVEEHGSCRVCAAPCRGSQIETLKPGESVEWQWDGYAYRDDSVGGQSCKRRVVPRKGRKFRSEFCWATGDGSSGGTGELQNETCAGDTFAYGKRTRIVERVQ